MTDQPAPTEGGRPLGVLVVAALQFGRAALLVGQMLGFSLFPNVDWLHTAAQLPEPATGTVAFVIVTAIGIGLAAASVLAGIGLLAGRRWGWIASIVICGLSLAFALGAWWDGHPVYAAMVINIVAVFYLNQREVRAIFGELQPRDRLAP
jgi:hypothetical protein